MPSTDTIYATGSGAAEAIYDAAAGDKPCNVYAVDNLDATATLWIRVEPLHSPGKFVPIAAGRSRSFRVGADRPGGDKITRVLAYASTRGAKIGHGPTADFG